MVSVAAGAGAGFPRLRGDEPWNNFGPFGLR